MKHKISMVASLLAGVLLANGSQGEPIERPASPNLHDASVSSRVGTSKSKLIPIRHRVAMNGDRSSSSAASISKSTKILSGPRLAVASETEGEAQPEDFSGIDPWDSAARRFDQHDPANHVTKGVRVEDIIEPTTEYRYVAGRRKNPFIPDIRIAKRSQKKEELNPNDVEIPIISPLQSFAATQLSVIGVWEGEDRVWKALIKTPTNEGIETKLGDPAGNSGGRIMAISPEAVIVREFSVRPDGTREYRDIPLRMGGDYSNDATSSVGGRLILRPGASSPEIEPPDQSASPTQLIPQAAPLIVPTSVSGALTTIVPAAEQIPGLQPQSGQTAPSISFPAQAAPGASGTISSPVPQGGPQ